METTQTNVQQRCLPALEELLPPSFARDLYTNSVNHNTGGCDEIGFVDALTAEVAGSVGGVPRGKPGFFLRISRERLRTYLWQYDDLPVSSGKHFTHYAQDEAGVTAFFSDGSSVHGKLLVGADGLHSHVLDQLVGKSQHKPTLSQYVPIFGEVDLPPALYKPLRALAKSAIVTAAPTVRQQIGMLSMAEDQSTASYFWALMPRRDEPKELSDWVQSASQSEIYDFSLEITKDLHPTMTDLIRHGGAEAIAQPQPKFLEFVPPQTMPEGRVTVLGDAAHAMIPFRGAGANTAMLDACDLGKLLVSAWRDKEDSASVLHSYHEVMVPRGRAAVLSSRAAGEEGGEDPAKMWRKNFERPAKD